MSNGAQEIGRDPTTGRYDVSNPDRMCVCGHKFANHCGISPYPCYHGMEDEGQDCDCPKFRLSRKNGK